MRNPWFKYRMRRYSRTNNIILSSIFWYVNRSACWPLNSLSIDLSCFSLFAFLCGKVHSHVCLIFFVRGFLLKLGVIQYQNIFFDQSIMFIPNLILFAVSSTALHWTSRISVRTVQSFKGRTFCIPSYCCKCNLGVTGEDPRPESGIRCRHTNTHGHTYWQTPSQVDTHKCTHIHSHSRSRKRIHTSQPKQHTKLILVMHARTFNP